MSKWKYGKFQKRKKKAEKYISQNRKHPGWTEYKVEVTEEREHELEDGSVGSISSEYQRNEKALSVRTEPQEPIG